MLESPLGAIDLPDPELERLTETERVRILAALGYALLRSPEVSPQGLALLLKLSDPQARLWVQRP